MEAFQEQLRAALSSLGITDFGVYEPYIVGILEDSSSSEAEVKDSIADFLSAATEKDVGPMVDRIMKNWAALPRKTAPAAPGAPKSKQTAHTAQDVLSGLRAEMSAVSLADPKANGERLTKEQKDEKKKRDLLLEKYGFEVAQTDSEGNLVLSDPADSHKRSTGANLEGNLNAARVANEDKSKREQAKAAHERQVAQNKDQQAKEAARREAAKQRTQKQERKGRGN
jgi:hypothetical protein